ncbi:MAG TPA: prolyl oligopeptidase family serine peptidase, partial [Thermoanaerobaculia bacterium]|nr:prolyl oligopeptidase family serine peptidase [Thermoanaerobaculia bacterium]
EHAERIFGLALSDDGSTVAYRHSTASRREQLYGARLEGTRLTGARALTRLNEGLADRPLAKTEIVRWRGANDEEVEGILYYPHGWQEGRRHPLVLSIHGGPAAADLDLWDDDWAYPSNLFAQRGAFVLKANYHGSSNYGLDWVESICCGRYYELEIPDLERGVDALVARGLVDPERVGTMGWSNGSILSIQLMVENPARYKAAAVGAGDVEWISDWGNVDFGHAFDSYYFGATPLSDPERYLAKSPLFRLDRVTTPTLIFFGTDDRNVPPGQGWTHYRALQHLGRAPVRFLLFPGEPHSLGKPSHRLRKVEEEMAWFDRHLFGKTPKETPAVAPDSPLAGALARARAARHEGRLGVAAGTPPRLVPEVVPCAGLEVGRFEVTRAQWAAFDPAAIPAPGTEELPAAGISHERALAYAAWLSALTGDRYRLPTAAEAEELYAAREGENTLDRWAGYAPNPEDAAALLAAAAALGGEAPLLLPVGSLPPACEGERGEAVFDLGGNAAEWVTGEGGRGLPQGGSADRPHDARERTPSPAPAYVGLRVVREPTAGGASGGTATP